MSLRAGVIGLGIGEKHVEGLLRHPKCKVVAICDFAEEKYHYAKSKYADVFVTKDADEVLENDEIDVVAIASYDNYHYEQIVKAIENNKHVFVEKPLCLCEEQAKNIRSLLRKKPNIQLSSNLILRKLPRFILLKQMIDNGDMGELFYVEGDYNYGRLHKITDGWRGKIGFYSVVYGGGVHMVDLLIWLTGDMVVEVAAYGNNISSKGSDFHYNDMVVAILKFKSGLIGKITANFGCVFPHFHKLSIYGTRATFENGLKEGTVYNSRDPGVTPNAINAEYSGVNKGDLIYNFINAIIDNIVQEVSVDDVFSTMSVCFAIEKASTLNQTIPVSYI